MKKYKVLIIGCGQLGSRHLQAVAYLHDVGEVHIVDPRYEALELGKIRLKEINDLNNEIKFKWFNEPNKDSSDGDLCIIATQAANRCQIVKDMVSRLKYRNFLVEKIVSQSNDEYHGLMNFIKEEDVNVWVNCKTRTYGIHKYIKTRLDSSEPIVFTRICGNHGLASNGLHAADLFVFYDKAEQIKMSGIRIDPIIHPSKRGDHVCDLSGSLYGYTDKGSDFILSFFAKSKCPDYISILSPRARFIVDHHKRWAYESYEDSDWQWRMIPIDENWMVSHMTKKFAFDILKGGKCELPTLSECFPAHQFILESLLPYFNRLLRKEDRVCPVT